MQPMLYIGELPQMTELHKKPLAQFLFSLLAPQCPLDLPLPLGDVFIYKQIEHLDFADA
jgi:hypothetical protein